jgi:hypothetical protein
MESIQAHGKRKQCYRRARNEGMNLERECVRPFVVMTM